MEPTLPAAILSKLSQQLSFPKPRYTYWRILGSHYIGSVDIDGRVLTSTTRRDYKKDVKQDAAYLALRFFSRFPDTIPVAVPKSYAKELSELCQKMGWSEPNFEFEGISSEVGWKCNISINVNGWHFTYEGVETVGRKRYVKENTAKAVFEACMANVISAHLVNL